MLHPLANILTPSLAKPPTFFRISSIPQIGQFQKSPTLSAKVGGGGVGTMLNEYAN